MDTRLYEGVFATITLSRRRDYDYVDQSIFTNFTHSQVISYVSFVHFWTNPISTKAFIEELSFDDAEE